jgi:RPA family protein
MQPSSTQPSTQSGSTGRIRRQPAVRMLAQEYTESSLQERGSGQFDPNFVITKLGAKINRAIVAGLLESLQPRETSSGTTMWQGTLRDASGLHYFSIGDFQDEGLLVKAEEWSKNLQEGDPLLMMMVAKTRLFQSDDGAVYTSLHPEEMCIIDGSTYANWLVESADATMRRVTSADKARGLEVSAQAFAEAGVDADHIEGLVLARAHYGDFDPEVYKLTVMRALDLAEGKSGVADLPNQPKVVITDNSPSGSEKTEDNDNTATDIEVLRATIESIVRSADQGDGVDLTKIIANCQARGFSSEDADAALDELVSDKVIDEHRFGWFKIHE